MNEERSNDSRSSSNHGTAWMQGVVLVILGIIFLYHNFGGYHLHHWWALFILIPAVSSLAKAWRIYQQNGNRFSSAMKGPIVEGTTLSFVALIFLMDWNWGSIWPVFLIIGGIGALISAKPSDKSKES
jgi:O-antigen/teichoic acid export membrane protein